MKWPLLDDVRTFLDDLASDDVRMDWRANRPEPGDPAPALSIEDLGCDSDTSLADSEIRYRNAMLGTPTGEAEILDERVERGQTIQRRRLLRNARKDEPFGPEVRVEITEYGESYVVRDRLSRIREAFPDQRESARRAAAGMTCGVSPQALSLLPG